MNITETQRTLLEAAAQHPERQLLEFPANLKGGARIKVLTAMVNAQLICASTEDPQLYVATQTGLEAIGIATQPTTKPVSGQAPEQTQRVTREGTKQAVLIDLLKRPEGATLPQMTQATGWQVHTVRGAMAGALKKKLGLRITSEKQPGLDRIYRIVAQSLSA